MKRYDWALLLFFAAVFLLPPLYTPLGTPLEFATFNVSCAMNADGNYIQPSLLAEVQPLRPVAGFWLIGFAEKIFGCNAFALSFFPAVAIGLTALLLALTVMQCTGDRTLSQMSAFFFLGSSLTMNYRSLPISATVGGFFLLAALYSLFLAAREDKFNLQRFNLLVMSGICLAALVLCRGIVPAVFSLLVMAIFLLTEKRVREGLILPTAVLSIAVAALMPYFKLLLDEELPLLDMLKDATTRDFFSGENDVLSTVFQAAVRLILPCGIFGILLFTHGGRSGRLSAIPNKNSLCIFSFCILLVLPAFYSFAGGTTLADFYPAAAPISFLVALGSVDYLRGSNRRRTFHWLMTIVAILLMLLSTGYVMSRIVNSPFTLRDTLAADSRLYLGCAAVAFWGLLLLLSARGTVTPRVLIYIIGMTVCFLLFNIPQRRLNPTEQQLRDYRLLYETGNSRIYSEPQWIQLASCVTRRPDIRYFRGSGAQIRATSADGRRFEDCVRNATQDAPVLLLASNLGPAGNAEMRQLPPPRVFPCGRAKLYVWPQLKEVERKSVQ